ncbi:Myc-type, basic helix-loop-helix domain-containing protein [Tanacetum coccineum]|uniref:Myc-type, basic helix-loop-helix domain-containing protein n=1 Tax=Tanacetum coccineum TaxID=301880 RepID=A0ABQ5FE29_9ASTR
MPPLPAIDLLPSLPGPQPSSSSLLLYFNWDICVSKMCLVIFAFFESEQRPKLFSLEFFSLACGPSSNATLYTACLVNGVRFMVHYRDINRTTQTSGVSTPGPNGETYYGEQILELTYIGCNKVVLFGCKWFDISNVKRFYTKHNIKHINTSSASTALYCNQPYILATQARQVFYLDDPGRRPLHWKVIEYVNHTKNWHGDKIVIEDNEDVIHDNIDVALSADLDDLDFVNMSMNDESTEVDAPTDDDNNDDDPDIIYYEDDVAIEIRDDEEDFVVESDDDVEPMACLGGRSHGGNARGEPPRGPNRIPNQCEGWVVRGTTTNKEFRKAISRNKNRSLPLEFDDNDQKTFKAVGVFRLAVTFKQPDYNNRWQQVAYSGVTSPGWATMQFQRLVERQEKQAQCTSDQAKGMAGIIVFWADPLIKPDGYLD